MSPSETETFVIRFKPEYVNTTLFFGLKVKHSRGRISEVSNIESVAIVYVPEEPQSSEPGDHSGVSMTAVLVGTASGVVFIVLIIVAVCLVSKWHNRGRVSSLGQLSQGCVDGRGGKGLGGE